ncbi:hypothetical protein ILUMI_13936 [Ignelater luminosus]|uniref:Uncharacterized protein n=1 Tax=Ignelater luminosus TaxID=2038154 RepID=A0A8K0CV77_IGNLU|nr:hypothetical protein ILUMI_13936 [Ignelater luminosus]
MRPVPHGLEVPVSLRPDKLNDVGDEEMISQACANELNDGSDDYDPGSDEPKLHRIPVVVCVTDDDTKFVNEGFKEFSQQ